RPDRRPGDRRAPEGVLEAGEEVGGHRDPSRPLGRRLLPAAPGGEPETADGAPMPVGRLPVETSALEVGDLRGEAEDERRPLAVDRGVARARAREQARRRVALEDEGGHEEIERPRERDAPACAPCAARIATTGAAVGGLVATATPR